MRLAPSHTPYTPHTSIACIVYNEHDGWNRHAGGVNGLMNRR